MRYGGDGECVLALELSKQSPNNTSSIVCAARRVAVRVVVAWCYLSSLCNVSASIVIDASLRRRILDVFQFGSGSAVMRTICKTN